MQPTGSLHTYFQTRASQLTLMANRWMLTTKQDQAFGDAMREATQSFFRVMESAIRIGRHGETGGLLYNIAERCFPGFDTHEINFEELQTCTSSSSDAARDLGCNDLREGYNVLNGLVCGLRSTFREQLTCAQYWNMASGFEREYRRCLHHVAHPLWLMRMTESPPPEVPEDMYRNMGPPIDMAMFCQSTPSVPIDTACPICIADVTTDTNEASQKPVVTTCVHYFHEQCLDAWVKDSAMSKSHTCPSCRAVLCEARLRIPADTPALDWVYYP